MTKNEQIEEMAKIMLLAPFFHSGSSEDFLLKRDSAKELYNAGYRKIDDDCAVITKDELKQYKAQAVKEFAGKLWNKIKDNGIDYKIGLRALGEEIDELLKDYEK